VRTDIPVQLVRTAHPTRQGTQADIAGMLKRKTEPEGSVFHLANAYCVSFL
jgi:hypothetical protein